MSDVTVNPDETLELVASQADGADIPDSVVEPPHQDPTPLEGSPS